MSESLVRRERIRVLRDGPVPAGPVAYWMSRDQRANDNWALLHAQELAWDARQPLAVVFCLMPVSGQAGIRQLRFMLDGLRETAVDLSAHGIPFAVLTGRPESVLPPFLIRRRVRVLVTDFDPLHVKQNGVERVRRKVAVPFLQVDSHNIVPCWTASPKLEWAAYTFRPKIRRLLPDFLEPFPRLRRHPFGWTVPFRKPDWEQTLSFVRAGSPSDLHPLFQPGQRAGVKVLRHFLREKLPVYRDARNNPAVDGQSGLSPYLHFGQLSAQRVVLAARQWAEPGPSLDAFLEELIVRRELSDNYCFYNARHDTYDGFPDWARRTLHDHRSDPRPYRYTLRGFESAATHDRLWNAAQVELVKIGKMHGYMRMYWAKKILEWTADPEEAFGMALHLNDKYELDGSDPNGVTGCAWSIGGVHDRAWPGRPVFGKIRAMTANGLKAKFDTEAYIRKTERL